MTQLAVPIMVESLDRALAASAAAAEHGADLVEYRIDNFADDPAQVVAMVERSALPCILTCRPTWEGGDYAGDEAVRLAVLQAAAEASRPPAYIDVELRSELHARLKLGGDTGLILSIHDFTGRPADLTRRIEQMAAHSLCRVIKVAWFARSLRDNLEAFEIIAARHKSTIALCMGEFGLPSRVLARKFGALLTFAALDEGAGTAPGQPTVAPLKQLYRWDKLGCGTRVYGVIGYPIAHSMSPAIHNAGFDEVGHDGVYLPLPIPPEYEHFKATVGSYLAMDELHFRGASVTIPHKQNLMRFAQEQGGEIEPLAQRIGAANTLTVGEDGSLYASNSDYAGALDSLPMSRDQLNGKRVAVIGAGGAARAVVAGFAEYGADVQIHNRTHEKAERLAADFDVQAVEDIPTDSEIYINCTSVGMHPNVDDTPIPADVHRAGAIVFDTIYNPRETRLLREAKAAGSTTIGGAEMFVRQAAAQFEPWTGANAPIETFRRVMDEQLG